MNKRVELLYKIISERILVLDGAMGSLIQTYNLQEEDYRGERFKNSSVPVKGNNDMLSISRPDIISKIHEKYLKAGADIIETNTFNSTLISQADYNLDNEEIVYDLNYYSAKLARDIADKYSEITPDKPRFVCGSMGPLNKSLSLSPDVNNPGYRATTFDEVKESYKLQAKGLIDGGCDILLIETVFDTLNAKAALFAIHEVFEELNIELPIMISGTITDAAGRVLSGQTLQAFLDSVSHFKILSIGLNCSFGAAEMAPYLAELSNNAPFYISTHPNAGLPNRFGEYDQTPEEMSSLIEPWLDAQRVNIIGGCCGTTPNHIAKIAETVKRYNAKNKSHTLNKPDTITHLSGLESLQMRKDLNFINIGERCNVAGSRKFLRLIKEKNYEEAVEIARTQVENGAQIIDVNMDDAMLDAKHEMITFLNMLMSEPEVAKVPVMVDSSKFEVIEAGLKCLQGKSVVNSISLKEGEEKFLKHASTIRNYGAAVVVMAFDEKGQADNYERRIEICSRAYKLLTKKLNFPPQDIIFDPNVLAIGTGIEEHNNYAVDFIKAAGWIKKNLPHAHISGGISNLSFSFRGNNVVREAMHSAFLFHAIKEGLDMGIVNPAMLQVYDDVPKKLLTYIEDVIFNRRSDATDRLVEYAETIKNQNQKNRDNSKKLDWRTKPLEERLSYCLIKGISEFLNEDINEAISIYSSATEIIEKPLMDGMNKVGELFGSGKMFLPQVVKTARVMKKAVAILQPHIEKEKSSEGKLSYNGKILMATVKGDVHDIGKNIVSVILACNNYEIIDLGVMVPSEKIIEEAINQNVDVIGLSGLITPSLEEMVTVAKLAQEKNLSIPIMIGGATTSSVHTAVKIAPEYSNTIVHVKDASQSSQVASSLLSDSKKEYIAKLKKKQEEIRISHSGRKVKQYLSYEEAKANKFKYTLTQKDIKKPELKGIKIIRNHSLKEIRSFIDWSFFFKAWNISGVYKDIENIKSKDDEKIWLDKFTGKTAHSKAMEALKLWNDANAMLDNIENKKMLQANAIFGIFDANSIDDDIVLYTNETKEKQLCTFNQIRQQQIKNNNNTQYSLADFIAPKQSGINDYIGAFALTTGIGVEKWEKRFIKNNDDYSAILLKSLADRLAEAFAELLHYKIRTQYWAYSPDEKLDIAKMKKEKYQGIRPAMGYPASPDHSEKQKLFNLLNVEKNIGISLTEHFSMFPHAAICGLYFAHPEAKYFATGKITSDQIKNLAQRKHTTVEDIKKWIPTNIAEE